MAKILVWIGLVTGSIVGGFVPSLWGASAFSVWGIFASGIGAIIGIWLGFKVSRM